LDGESVRSPRRADPGDRHRTRRSWWRTGGVDDKYRKCNLTSDLVLDLTVNTDSAQRDIDDQQINRSLVFPEK